MNAESIIRDLLLSFNDARSPLTRGERGSGGGWAMSSEWKSGSYQPLEDALKEMHSLGKQQAVCGVPLSTLWWHLQQRYLMSERKAIWKVGEHTVDEMVHWRSCKSPCQIKFHSTTQARAHIEHVHKPKPELVMRHPKQYQLLLHDQPKRCERCENLAVGWLAGWFQKRGITPRLPKEKS